MKKAFKNDEDMFDSRGKGQFYRWGRYADWLDMRYPDNKIKKMYLVSRASGEEQVVAVGVQQINKYMKMYELEFGDCLKEAGAYY